MSDAHISPEQIAELERLEKAATPAPWPLSLCEAVCRHVRKHVDLCDILLDEEIAGLERYPFYAFGDPVLIAAMRNALPGLLATWKAVRDHRDQKADDRCWIDDATLYDAAGLGHTMPSTFQVGDIPAMEANCHRFLRQRCLPGGTWKSYAELEAENAELERQLSGLGTAVLLEVERVMLAHGLPRNGTESLPEWVERTITNSRNWPSRMACS